MFTSFPSRGASGGIPHWFRDDRAHRCVQHSHFLLNLAYLKIFSGQLMSIWMTNICHINTLLANSSSKSVDLNLLFTRYSSLPKKNKAVRTVVNKLNAIDNQFRFFKMELLAGEPDYVVVHVSHLSLTFLSLLDVNFFFVAWIKLSIHIWL